MKESALRIYSAAQTIEENPNLKIKMKFADQKKRLNILFVDDDGLSLKVSKEILELKGNFRVYTATSVEEALKKMETQRYDVIVSDYKMPSKNGLDLLKEMCQSGNTTPFILFTGKGGEEVADKAFNLGAFWYLEKHGDTETVYSELSNYVLEAFNETQATVELGKPEYFPPEICKNSKANDAWREYWSYRLQSGNIVTVSNDSIKKKRVEERTKERTEEANKILDDIGDLLFVMDRNRRITRVNKSTCEAFKKRPEELLGRHCYEIVHGTDRPWPDCPATKTFETKQKVTEEIADPNVGIPLLITTSPILNEKGEITQVIHVAKDITKIKLAEMEMHIAANLFDAASDTILVHDLEGKIVYFNESAHKLQGYSRDEFQELRVTDLEVPGTTWDFRSRMKALLDNGKGTFETYNMSNDKTIVPFEIHARIIESDGRKLVLSVARDVTERKKAEEKLKESSKRIEMMNEKLRVVGGLTRHDVRNKLCAVTGNAYLLRKKHADQADILHRLDKMEQAVKEIGKIFDFAKMYEQLGVEELSFVDVEKTANEAVALFSDLTVKVVNECKGLTLLADSFLRQLFYNFIDNTRKYGKTANEIRVHYEKAEHDKLRLIYMDDGVGISAEDKLKLFKEGFSTGGSTGFGLFLSKKMMDVYGWEIKETGEPGKGAKFVITIPKTNQNGQENYQIQPTV